jgi:DNA-dependent RNA polymerase auxiliary subunit epsilon
LDFNNRAKERKKMIFKVYYQEHLHEVPVRESTKAMYMKAENIRSVLSKLKDRPINIEFVQLLEGPYLEYEKQGQDYLLEEIV